MLVTAVLCRDMCCLLWLKMDVVCVCFQIVLDRDLMIWAYTSLISFNGTKKLVRQVLVLTRCYSLLCLFLFLSIEGRGIMARYDYLRDLGVEP